MQRYLVFLLAVFLPLLMAGEIAPKMARELDFWLMWLVAMLAIGLPVLFIEVALSARTAQSPWLGMQKLTREADAGVIWRVFSGLSVLMTIFLSAYISNKIADGLTVGHLADFGKSLQVPTLALSAGVSVVALILSALRGKLLPVGVLLMVIAAAWALVDNSVSVPVLTEVSLSEWSMAALLALLCTGVGTGLYWFGSSVSANEIFANKKSLTGYILPIWLMQLIFGSLAILASGAMMSVPAFAIGAVGMVIVSAFLLYYAANQLIARFGMIVGVIATVILALLASIVPTNIVWSALVVVSLLAVLALAIFAGFVMKISHLRKTLNFGSELRYNIWRVLVRIIVPVGVLAALTGLIMGYVQ